MGITNEENEYFGINSGDGLYFKTFKGFDNIVSNEKKITTIIQSVYVAISLNKFEYASLLLIEYKSIIPNALYDELLKIILSNFYIPNLLPIPFPRISFLFYILSAFFGGKRSHTKSFPKINRLVKSKYLYINLFSKFFKNRYRQKLFKKYEIYKIKKSFDD